MPKRIGFLIVVALLLVGSMLPLFADNVAAAPLDAGAFIIDHTSANITQIPEWAIATAKYRLHIGYGRMSHGEQLTGGMTGLVAFANGDGLGLSHPEDIFAWNNGDTGGVELDLEEGSGTDPGWLQGYIGYYPQWVNETIEYLASDNHTDTNVIMWAHSYQLDDWYRQSRVVSDYLAPMASLQASYPNVTFVYMTGPTYHPDDADVRAANQLIRQWCTDNGTVLYDFWDIESWDPIWDPTNPNGPYYEFTSDNCDYYNSADNMTAMGNWAQEWQNSHTVNVDWYICYSPHTEDLNGNLKAYAAWWLWARLAGWDGTNDQALASYRDAAHNFPDDIFEDFGTEHTVFMYGTDLLPDHNYRVSYYDGSDIKRVNEIKASNASGNLSSQHEFNVGVDVAGIWNVIISETDFIPSDSYNGSWSYTITSDNFTVAESAIPEFPTVMAAIAAFSLCIGVYLWMRRKAVPVPA